VTTPGTSSTDFGTSRSRSARAATCHENAGEAGAGCFRPETVAGTLLATPGNVIVDRSAKIPREAQIRSISSRRAFLHAGTAALAFALFPRLARATLARGLSLEELAHASDNALVGTVLDAHCSWAVVARQRSIVTDTRMRVEEVLAKRNPDSSEVLVRTLGGAIGRMGERVDGQPRFSVGERAVVFLLTPTEGSRFVAGWAQGHYPLRADARGVRKLAPSPGLPELLRREGSAVQRLSGLELSAAREAILEVLR
jgi:hypothetical protein